MRISSAFNFEASHVVPNHSGKCKNLHGHSWKLVITLRGSVDSETQMVMDYADLKAIVQPLVDKLDHTHLNLAMFYPTAENIAAWFGAAIRSELNDWKHSTDADWFLTVAVSETQRTWAVWNQNDPIPWGAFPPTPEQTTELLARTQSLYVPLPEIKGAEDVVSR